MGYQSHEHCIIFNTTQTIKAFILVVRVDGFHTIIHTCVLLSNVKRFTGSVCDLALNGFSCFVNASSWTRTKAAVFRMRLFKLSVGVSARVQRQIYPQNWTVCGRGYALVHEHPQMCVCMHEKHIKKWKEHFLNQSLTLSQLNVWDKELVRWVTELLFGFRGFGANEINIIPKQERFYTWRQPTFFPPRLFPQILHYSFIW